MKRYANWWKVWQSSRKYKGTVNAGKNIRLHAEGDVLLFRPRHYDDVTLGELPPDDVFTVLARDDDLRTWRAKYAHLIGVDVCSHRKTKTQVNTLTCREADKNWSEQYPFVTGLRYDLTSGIARCINGELAVQMVRRVKPDVQQKVTKTLAPISAACRVLTRLDAYENIDRGAQWFLLAEQAQKKLEKLRLDQVTTETFTPQDVFHLGLYNTAGVWAMQWRSSEDAAPVRKRAVDNGLRRLREHFYGRLDGYVVVAKDSLTQED